MYESYNEWHKLELESEVEFDKFITYSLLNIIIFLTQNQVIKKNAYTIRIFGLHISTWTKAIGLYFEKLFTSVSYMTIPVPSSKMSRILKKIFINGYISLLRRWHFSNLLFTWKYFVHIPFIFIQ